VTAAEPIVGRDGAASLALACMTALLTCGASLVLAWLHVARIAWRTGTAPARGSGARIVVLGHKLERGRPGPAFIQRLARAAALARDGAAPVILLGGRTSRDAPSEAEAGRDWLLAAGVDARRIALEAQSRHTLENLRNYRAHFPPALGPDLLVTSRVHMARASLMASGLGLPHMPCAAEESWRPGGAELAQFLFEGFLVHWYVVGRFFARIAHRRAWLARIS